MAADFDALFERLARLTLTDRQQVAQSVADAARRHTAPRDGGLLYCYEVPLLVDASALDDREWVVLKIGLTGPSGGGRRLVRQEARAFALHTDLVVGLVCAGHSGPGGPGGRPKDRPGGRQKDRPGGRQKDRPRGPGGRPKDPPGGGPRGPPGPPAGRSSSADRQVVFGVRAWERMDNVQFVAAMCGHADNTGLVFLAITDTSSERPLMARMGHAIGPQRSVAEWVVYLSAARDPKASRTPLLADQKKQLNVGPTEFFVTHRAFADDIRQLFLQHRGLCHLTPATLLKRLTWPGAGPKAKAAKPTRSSPVRASDDGRAIFLRRWPGDAPQRFRV